MKTCRTCDTEKPLDEFHKDKQNLDGFRNECKACATERRAQWQADNAEHYREYRHKWQVENADSLREIAHARYWLDVEKSRAKAVAAYWRDPDKYRTKRREQYAKTKERRLKEIFPEGRKSEFSPDN